MDEKTPGIISSILSIDAYRHPVQTSANVRQDKTQELGTPRFQLFDNPAIAEYRDLIMERLLDDEQLFSTTLVINKQVLDDDELMNAIRDKALKQGKPSLIRIADQGYTLTREDYQKLSFVTQIAVDECVDDLVMENNIIIQSEAFKFGTHEDIQPVLERRNQFDELIPRNIFHVNHPLSDSEFQYLVDCINKTEDVSIELDYFNPDYYEEFLQKLQSYHVKDNINIQLVGYLLEDKIDTFTRLERFPYEIDVVYSTCHDMVDMYTVEPYTENRMYYSQVEGGGKTSLGNYLNILEELSNFEAMARAGNYSPLEIAILAKVKIDSDYIYDPDHSDNDTDYWDNVNLSQMIHHQENGKKRAICVGFATLYSAYCRRCGIPMFRYSTRGHMRTVGRIQDEKYGIDTIGTADITWDLPDQNGYTHSYKYFMGSPRDFTMHQDDQGRHEFLTVADVFALPMEDFDRHIEDSRDPVESFYSQVGYNPMGYTARLLELMKVAPETELFDLYDTIYGLCERGCFEGIPEETLLTAITNVLRSLKWSDERIESYLQEVRDNQQLRQTTLNNPPAIGTTDGLFNNPVDVITKDNVQGYRDRLWNSGISRPIYVHTPITIGTDQEQNPEITPTEPQPTIDRENLDYVHQVIDYCNTNNISIYNYYHNIGNMYHGDSFEQIPAFEAGNPFLDDRDKTLVATAEEELIVHYFANAMMKVIQLNLTPEEARQFERLFTRDSEDYVNAVTEEMNDKIEEKEELGKGSSKEQTPDPTLTEETNPEYHPEDYSEEFIPGTNIHRPRERGIYESDEDYVDFLRDFYRRHFPNAEYVQAVLDYCGENQMNIYDYYYQVGNILKRGIYDGLPEFEMENPFLSEGDLELLRNSQDDMILTYFANTMMKTIGLNISDFKRDQLAEMFPDEIENYTVAVEEQYHK